MIIHQRVSIPSILHNRWFWRTILVKDGKLAEAYRQFNKMLTHDEIFAKHRRTRYCEKPFNYRRRKCYEVSKAIYDEDMSRKIRLIMRQDREDPWIGS